MNKQLELLLNHCSISCVLDGAIWYKAAKESTDPAFSVPISSLFPNMHRFAEGVPRDQDTQLQGFIILNSDLSISLKIYCLEAEGYLDESEPIPMTKATVKVIENWFINANRTVKTIGNE